MITINGTKLFNDIRNSSFSMAQVTRFINVNGAYFNQVQKTGRINEEKLDAACKLVGLSKNRYIEHSKPVTPPTPKVEPKPQTYEPPVRKPLTAREDPNQNWMINIYRAIEDMNDRLDILIHEMKEQTAAIRGLSAKVDREERSDKYDDHN